MLQAAGQIHDDFHARRLAPECAGKHHLDLSQLVNLFRGIGLFNGKAAWGALPDGAPAYFAVFCRGWPYFLPMPDAATPLPAVRAALADIVRHSRTHHLPPLALLSAQGIRPLARRQPGITEETLRLANLLAAARMVLCLDLDASPQDHPRAGYLTQTSFQNRWFLHGCNLVVFGNGAWGAHMAFGGGIDGNIGARFTAELADRVREAEQRGALVAADADTAAPHAAFVPAEHPPLSPRIEARYRDAAVRWVRAIPGVFTLPIGENACRAAGVRPVEAFVAALSATLAELGGRRPGDLPRIPIRQFVSQGRYAFGTLNAAEVNTPELFAVAHALLGAEPGTAKDPALRERYLQAEAVIRERTDQARRLRVFNRSLTRGAARRMAAYLVIAPLLFPHRARRLLDRSHHAIAEAAISYVGKKEGVSLMARPGTRAPDGMLWLHYQIFAEETVVIPCFGGDAAVAEATLMSRLEIHWKSLLDRLGNTHVY
jgi:hypothetical protein